jgi:TPP-dependent pyruvate/acetoin dehydrogenase alpha subunit
MDYDDDPTAVVRARRPMPDDQVLEMAEKMAELRLFDEEMG